MILSYIDFHNTSPSSAVDLTRLGRNFGALLFLLLLTGDDGIKDEEVAAGKNVRFQCSGGGPMEKRGLLVS